jgi:hypothetical protein
VIGVNVMPRAFAAAAVTVTPLDERVVSADEAPPVIAGAAYDADAVDQLCAVLGWRDPLKYVPVSGSGVFTW